MITFDSDFPVYGDITSIDQVERIQEYVDNKILDSLSWIAGKLDLIIRGHTLAIGMAVEHAGKNIKQEQRRIQRTIDKYEKTSEVAVFTRIVHEEPGQLPSGDDFDRETPPIEEPFPWEPPTLPPSPPPTGDGDIPPVTCVPGGLVPCPPGQTPGGNDSGDNGNGNDTGNDTGDGGENGNGNNNNNNNYVDCNYSSQSVYASTRPDTGAIVRNNTIIYGGQLDICATLNKLGGSVEDYLTQTLGNSQQVFHYSGTFFPYPVDGTNWNWYSDVPQRAVRVHNYNAPRIPPSVSTPFDELGEAIAKGNTKFSDGTIRPTGSVDYPSWMHDTTPFVDNNINGDAISMMQNINPDIEV